MRVGIDDNYVQHCQVPKVDYQKIMSGDEGLWKLVSLNARIHVYILIS